jgi:hypothetical protein
MFDNWEHYTLRKQTLIVFGTLTFFALFVPDLVSVTYISVVSSNIKNDAHDILLAQATNNIKSITQDGADLIDRMFSTYANNYVNMVAFATPDCFRTDYPFGYIPSYYNWKNTLIDEFYDSNLNANITLNTSTYNVFNTTPNDIQYLNNNLKNTIDKTASLDLFFIQLHINNKDFLQQYIGTITKFQRNYPGSINYNNIMQYIKYDPTSDYWYTNTVANPNTIVYSSPYFDPIANQTMITISRTLNDVYTGSLFGAIGGDLALKTIGDIIKTITYLKSGRVLLFEKTGLLVADSKITHNRIVSYADYDNMYDDIKISPSAWNNLIRSDILFDSDYYYIQSITLETGGNKYVLLSFVSHDDIYSEINPLLDNISIAYRNNMIYIFCSLAAVLFCVTILVMRLVNLIVGELEQLANTSEQIISNIGSSSLVNGVEMKMANGVKETQMVFNKFKSFIDTYEQKKAAKNNGNIQNEYYSVGVNLKPPDYHAIMMQSSNQLG